MPRLLPRLARYAWPSWLGVFLSCLLSLTAPCDLAIFAQLVNCDGPLSFAAPSLFAAGEDVDRAEIMLRPASPQDGRRFERKFARAPLPLPEAPAPLLLVLVTFEPRPCLSGSEHARRNGVGAPLLC